MDVHAGNKKAIVITPCLYMVHMRVHVISYHLTLHKKFLQIPGKH